MGTGRAKGGERPGIADLVADLSELSSLVLATDSLDRVVWEAAMLAVHSMDAVTACGVTVLRDGAPRSIMADTAPFGRLENLQYEHDRGPVPRAMRERRVVVAGPDGVATDEGDRGGPARPSHEDGYDALAHELGVVSSVVMPLVVGDGVLGALSLYVTTEGHDLGPVRAMGELVADLAATALSCLVRQADQVKLTDELRGALESRAVIEQAKGVLIGRGHDADSAFALLRRTSQNRNVKLREVAAVVVETATTV